MAFLQGRGQVSMTKPAPNWKWNRLSLAASGLSLGLQLCSWIAMWDQQSFHGTSLICKSLNRWPATPSKPVSVVHLYNWRVKLLFNWALLRKKMYQPASYLIRFSSSRHCWKHLLLRDTLVLNIRHETTEWQMLAVEAQWPIGYGVGLRIKRSSVRIRPWPLRWVLGQGSLLPLSQGEAFTLASISYLAILVKYILAKKKKKKKNVHRPPTLTLRSRTGAAEPTLWPTLNPCHFTVPCFIYKTKTVSFSSKQALSNNVFGVKIGRTTTLRRLFKVIDFRRSKFVCTLWPGPVFGMCAAGLATHLTTPVCPVARTQTIILQVVYPFTAASVRCPRALDPEEYTFFQLCE